MEAEDLSQEVFLRAHRKLASLRDPARFGHWLYGIARIACAEWRRPRARDPHVFAGAAPGKSACGDQAAGNDADIARLRRAIASLPERERQALHAFYLQGLSAEQARAILGLSRSGFYRALQRARKRLERIVGSEWEESQ